MPTNPVVQRGADSMVAEWPACPQTLACATFAPTHLQQVHAVCGCGVHTPAHSWPLAPQRVGGDLPATLIQANGCSSMYTIAAICAAIPALYACAPLPSIRPMAHASRSKAGGRAARERTRHQPPMSSWCTRPGRHRWSLPAGTASDPSEPLTGWSRRHSPGPCIAGNNYFRQHVRCGVICMLRGHCMAMPTSALREAGATLAAQNHC